MAQTRDVATSIIRRLRQAGREALLAGGCVRDELLGLTPEDYDIATDARPDEVKRLFPNSSEVGASFGVMLVRSKGVTVEVATFRTEGVYSDKRRPDAIEYADAQADARRRDFTINALFLDPLATDDSSESDDAWQPPLSKPAGRVVDYVEGLADLRAGVVRAVGDADARLAEDHLRGLRAVRIAARLDFVLDAPTADAIRRHARELQGVSPERVGEELRKMLAHPSRKRAMHLIESLRLAAPALGADLGDDEPVPTPTVDALLTNASAMTALAAWSLDRLGVRTGALKPQNAPDIARALQRSICLSNAERDELTGVLRTAAILETDWPALRVAPRKRAAASRWFRAAVQLVDARDSETAAVIRADVGALERTRTGLAPAPLLTGEDVVALTGSPGPIVGDTLRVVYDAQLEGAITNREQALDLARAHLAKAQQR